MTSQTNDRNICTDLNLNRLASAEMLCFLNLSTLVDAVVSNVQPPSDVASMALTATQERKCSYLPFK